MAKSIKLILELKEPDSLAIDVRNGGLSVGRESLTLSQGLDILLIETIDKILASNRIDRLSLKSLEIRGKLRPGVMSSMVIETVRSALGLELLI